MGIKIVREASETPNINNTDDFVPFRYAYGNQDGYVIGKGNEVNIEQVDTRSVLIKSGRFVVQGVEVDVDANGITVGFNDVPQNSDVFVTVYAEVGLATNSVNMQKVFDTVDFPVVDEGDDLTHITNGTANIEIAHVKLSNGSIVSINKVIKAIEYSLNNTKDQNGILKAGEIIIPQKKLLWETENPVTNGELSPNKIIESIEFPDVFKNKILEIVITSRKGMFSFRIGDNGYFERFEIPLRFDSQGSISEKITIYLSDGNTLNVSYSSKDSDGDFTTKRQYAGFYKIYEVIQ